MYVATELCHQLHNDAFLSIEISSGCISNQWVRYLQFVGEITAPYSNEILKYRKQKIY